MSNRNLNKAKKAKNDEFYTKYETIEKEVKHYEKHFIDKVIYCNCDNTNKSNFFKYFHNNFNRLKLKGLIASCYIKDGKGLYVKVNRENISQPVNIKEFKGDGDFRSQESIELLKQADIVVTNPPFSLFREYIAQLIEYDKKFLVLGNTNAITYKETFPLIKNNKMWQGVNKGSFTFELPDNTSSTSCYIDEKDGKKKQKFGNITWWTNLEYPRRHEDIILFREYKGNESNYPKYDNYDAINVDKVADIPKDYLGTMGVPISFIGQWDPEQFEVLGATTSWDNSNIHNGKLRTKNPTINGKVKYIRILIKRRDNNE